MAHVTTNAGADDVLNTYLNKAFVSDLEYDLQHQKFTMRGDIPTGGGNVLRFNEFAAPLKTGYSTGTTALTEATTTGNEFTNITTTPTNLTLAEFGEFIKVGSLYDLAVQAGTRERLRKRMRDGANVSLDSYTRSKAVQTTNILYATLVATGGSSTAPATVGNFGAAILVNAKKVLKDGLATGLSGVEGHKDGNFAAVITEKQELDMVTEVTTTRMYWSNCVINVPGAMGQEKWVNGYIGAVYGTSVYTTNNYATFTLTSACDIGIVYADGGVGAASIGQMTPEIIINDVNSPYKNVNSIAWHTYYEAALLAAARVIKLYSLS